MGGKGSGGARPNSGPKRRDPAGAWLAGDKRALRGLDRPIETDAIKRPNGLSEEDKAVWDELAPLAIAQQTLTLASALAFADLCGFIVMERKLRVSALAAAGADHRGLIQRVESMRARFRLIPDGKPVISTEAPKDEWAEFDEPLKLVKG